MLTQPELISLTSLPLRKPLFLSGTNSFLKALRVSVFLIFSLFTSFPVFAQYTCTLDKTTHFDKLGVNEGLSTDFAHIIHQDKYGFIWIGTQRGLNLYDGYQVKSFLADANDSTTLLNDYILTIFEEDDGTMWFGTFQGISRYNRSNHTFSNYLPYSRDLNRDPVFVFQIVDDGEYLWIYTSSSLFHFNKHTGTFISYGEDTLKPEKGIKGKSYNDILTHSYTNLFKDESGTLWIASVLNDNANFILNRFNKESNTFTHFENDPSDPESFAGKRITCMIEDRHQNLWLTTRGGGLIKIIDKEKGRFKHYIHDDSDSTSVSSDELMCVFEDSKGNIWTAGSEGISEFNSKTGKFINYVIPYLKNNLEWLVTNMKIIEDPNGKFWIPTNGGLFWFDPVQKQFIRYLYDPESNYNVINQLIIDRSDQIWFCTFNKGVSIFNPFLNAFKRIQAKHTFENSLPDNNVTCIFNDSEDNFWVGTNGGGLGRAKIKNGKVLENFEYFKFNRTDPKNISSNYTINIYEDRGNSMWFGVYQGLNKYDRRNKKFTIYRPVPIDDFAIHELGVTALCDDSHGTFWVGTTYDLNIMDKKTGKFTRIEPDAKDPKSTMNTYIAVIFEDSRGELWIGGNYLERFNRKDSSFIHYLEYPNDKDRTIAMINDINEDDSGNLWFATQYGGLLHWDRKSQVFSAITEDEGLLSNFIVAIEIDDNGDIWAYSDQGLSRIEKHTHRVKDYNVADGLVSQEVNNKCGFKDKEGWLYFGTKYGITYFHPDSLKENKLIPPVYITAMNISGKQKFFEKTVYEMSHVELNYNENDLSFDYVALNYVNSQKNQYAYMLEGYDEVWNYVGNRRTAYYTNLNPGTYTFKVKGSNNDSYWNEEGANLVVIIHPPIWKTWWAYMLYVFVFFGILYLLRRYELNRLHLKQDLEIKQVETDKILELDEEKDKFFSNISHEFRTPLTLILGPLDRFVSQLKDKDQVNEINLVRRNARRLQTLINQLLSLSKLESGNMKLNTRPENIVKLTRMFVDSFHSMAEDKSIKLEFKSDEEEKIIYVDTLKYEKIVNNLMSNAFKFTEKSGKIRVSIFSSLEGEQRRVVIKFSDTGIGIRPERLSHVFDRFYQVDEQQNKTHLGTGIGLALTKELVELHHGEIKVESEFGMGTTFTIFLPSGTGHLTEDEIVDLETAGDEADDEMLQDRRIFVPDAVSKTLTTDEAVIEDSGLPLLLIVEDNADMRAYIKSYLDGTYQVLEASNGKEGAEMAIKYLPDLIVSDLMMPFMDGNEMARQLKNDERTSHIPIILLTAKSSPASKLEGLETGVDDFLTKPFDAEELQVRIKNLIELRKKLREMLSRHIGDESQTRIIRETAGKAMSRMDEQFLEKAVSVVNEHISNPEFSTELFSTEMAMSRVQLHRKLKSLTDNSTGDFIRNLRLKKAAELLKESGLNVTQVSYEVGISSLSYFSKVFKEKYGVNPSEYS